MLRSVLAVLFVCSSLLVISGCGSPRSSRPKPKVSMLSKWEAGQEFFANQNVENVFGPASAGMWKDVAAELKKPEFKAALDAFEAATMPEGADSKKASKDKIVKNFKAMIEEANGSADKKNSQSCLMKSRPQNLIS